MSPNLDEGHSTANSNLRKSMIVCVNEKLSDLDTRKGTSVGKVIALHTDNPSLSPGYLIRFPEPY